jgi:hypothetical protein
MKAQNQSRVWLSPDRGHLLAARKLAQYDGGKRVPATMSAIADAVRWVEEIMKAIDERWPAGKGAEVR